MKARLTGCLVAALFTIAGAASAEAACGTFEVAKGDVKVQSGPKVSAATQGSKICSGDSVITADQARAKIKMDDGNELNVSPNSKIVLEDYQYDPGQNKKKVLLNVLKGKIRAATREENMYNDKSKDGQANTFQVKTKSAVAGVRGTDFLTSFDVSNGRSEVVTFRGKVDVSSLGANGKVISTVQVGVGQSTSVFTGKAPEVPKALPAMDLESIETESTSPAQGASNQQPASQPASTVSMATDSELSGGTVAERGPASDVKAPGAFIPPVIPKTPTAPDLSQIAKDKVQGTTKLNIEVRIPTNPATGP